MEDQLHKIIRKGMSEQDKQIITIKAGPIALMGTDRIIQMETGQIILMEID